MYQGFYVPKLYMDLEGVMFTLNKNKLNSIY